MWEILEQKVTWVFNSRISHSPHLKWNISPLFLYNPIFNLAKSNIFPRSPTILNYLQSKYGISRLISQWGTFFFFKEFHFYLFIYLFLAVLGLRFCARAFSSCGERGPLFIAVRGPLTIAAPPVAEHRLQTRRLSSCGTRAQSLRGMWDLPRPGLEPVSPALVGRLSNTAPPGRHIF